MEQQSSVPDVVKIITFLLYLSSAALTAAFFAIILPQHQAAPSHPASTASRPHATATAAPVQASLRTHAAAGAPMASGGRP